MIINSDKKAIYILTCHKPAPGSRSVRTIEKVSGRQAGSAASGIPEGIGEGENPARHPPLFQSSPLTESLEQANVLWNGENVVKAYKQNI